jgi:hypothetical protein
VSLVSVSNVRGSTTDVKPRLVGFTSDTTLDGLVVS